MNVRTYLDILWADGTTELRVPSTQLQYASTDLDAHFFLPNFFVQMIDKGEANKNQFGIVEKVDPKNRLACVHWFFLDPGSQTAIFERSESHSAYELMQDDAYRYYPGRLVVSLDDGKVMFENLKGFVVESLQIFVSDWPCPRCYRR